MSADAFVFQAHNWEGGDPLQYAVPMTIVQEFVNWVLTDPQVRHIQAPANAPPELVLFHERCMRFRAKAHGQKVQMLPGTRTVLPKYVEPPLAMALERGGDPVTAAQIQAGHTAAVQAPEAQHAAPAPRKRGRPRKATS